MKESAGRYSRRLIASAAMLFILSLATSLRAETWSRKYIQSLPDSAFASVEITPEGKKIRHLPHHNRSGEVDPGHLKSALGRIHQVKWLDPADFSRARDHLEEHYREYR